MPETVDVVEFSSKRLLLEKFDVFHLHWPVETLVRHPNIWIARLRVLTFWLLLKLSKWRGTKIVWTIHDEKPHVVLHQSLADWIQARLVANTDSYINLCSAGEAAIANALPELTDKPSFVISHGHYQGYYPNNTSREDARSQLSLSPETTVLLYLGYISPYKNVPHLIHTFRQLSDTHRDATLLIAGQPDDEQLRQAVISAAQGAENIQLHLRFIQDEELQIFFKAADVVVLPFEEILNSGSLLLALSFNRPVVVPALGAVLDWQDQLGDNWVKTYVGALTPDVLLSAISSHPSFSDEAPLAALNWDVIAAKTLEVYERTCSHRAH